MSCCVPRSHENWIQLKRPNGKASGYWMTCSGVKLLLARLCRTRALAGLGWRRLASSKRRSSTCTASAPALAVVLGTALLCLLARRVLPSCVCSRERDSSVGLPPLLLLRSVMSVGERL